MNTTELDVVNERVRRAFRQGFAAGQASARAEHTAELDEVRQAIAAVTDCWQQLANDEVRSSGRDVWALRGGG